MNVEVFTKRMKEVEAEYPDGYTYSLNWMAILSRGFIVGYKETQDSFGDEGLRKCIQHAIEHEKIIGMWISPSGRKQYDSCNIFKEREKAIEFAKQNDQYSIWDLGEMEEIKV